MTGIRRNKQFLWDDVLFMPKFRKREGFPGDERGRTNIMITVSNVTKKFDDTPALSELSCQIPEGKIYGLVGSNGAGKSTLLRIMTGIYKADSGSVLFDGEPVYDNPAVKEQLVFVPDELYFLPNANMKRMAAFYRNYYPNFSMERFDFLTKKLGLNPKKNLSGFSKGMRRQAATILALACRPRYYFFDETFDGLDQIMRDAVKKLIFDDICERNATAVLTSHSLRELDNTCDELAMLHQGRLIFSHDTDTIKTAAKKVQVVFAEEMDDETFQSVCGVPCLSLKREGKVIQAIIKDENGDAESHLKAKNPLLLEVLSLSLEEIFTYEMESLGYTFDMESEA